MDSEAAVPDTAGRTKKDSGETDKTGKDSVGEAFEIRECDVSHDVACVDFACSTSGDHFQGPVPRLHEGAVTLVEHG